MLKILIGLASLALSCGAAFGSDDTQDTQPQSLAEGFARLERLLGRFDSDHNQQLTFEVDADVVRKPGSGETRIAVASKGLESYGNPFVMGNSIRFDNVEQIRRTVYDIDAAGTRTPSRHQQRFYASRFSLHRASTGEWVFDHVFLTHSIPQYAGRAYESGTVRWLPEGIELVGVGYDEFYQPGGRLVMGAQLTRRRIVREGDHVVAETLTETYHLAKKSDETLPVPDFANAFGEPVRSSLRAFYPNRAIE